MQPLFFNATERWEAKGQGRLVETVHPASTAFIPGLRPREATAGVVTYAWHLSLNGCHYVVLLTTMGYYAAVCTACVRT